MYPRCHPYWVDGNKKIENRKIKGVAYVSTGHLLPCCWCDGDDIEVISQYFKFGLFDEDLKVENNDSLINILLSPEWIDFHKSLLEDPDNAPRPCKKHCSKMPQKDSHYEYF